MIRKWWWAAAILGAGAVGCAMCQNPYDYCGPVPNGPSDGYHRAGSGIGGGPYVNYGPGQPTLAPQQAATTTTWSSAPGMATQQQGAPVRR